jgi:hypothetical protein
MLTMSRIISLYLFAALMLSASATAGSIKCWTDEHGKTACGDRVPPAVVQQGYRELNERGIEVKRHERAKTPEEIEREQALARLRAEQKQLLEEQKSRDRILLNLYRNEDDLVMARDGKIAQIDGQIRLNHAEIRRLKSRLSELQAVAANAERSGNRLTDRQRANLETTQRSIEKSYAIILGKEDEKLDTLEDYNRDLQRFRQLRKGGARSANADRLVESEFPDLVDTAVRCVDDNECAVLWKKAREYAIANTTTAIDLDAERILVSAPPRQLKDISITVSRLPETKRDSERIFMDVQCARFTEGQEYCRSDEVESIRRNFTAALEKVRGNR